MGFSEQELKAMMDKIRERKRQRTGPMVLEEVKMRPPRNSPGTTESGMQRRCVSWFRSAYPGSASLLFAIPNGGGRSKREGGILKAEGVLKGVPDLFLALPKGTIHGFFIEMKRGNQGRISPEQAHMIERLSSKGYKVEVIRSEEGFKDAINNYMDQ